MLESLALQGAYGSAAVSAATPASSWLSSLWSNFSAPFVSAGTTIMTAMPTTLATTAGQSLSTILMQKAGLIPKPAQPIAGGSVVYYQNPNQGTTPPASINIVQPAASGQANQGFIERYIGGSGTNWGIAALIGVVIIFLIMMLRK